MASPAHPKKSRHRYFLRRFLPQRKCRSTGEVNIQDAKKISYHADDRLGKFNTTPLADSTHKGRKSYYSSSYSYIPIVKENSSKSCNDSSGEKVTSSSLRSFSKLSIASSLVCKKSSSTHRLNEHNETHLYFINSIIEDKKQNLDHLPKEKSSTLIQPSQFTSQKSTLVLGAEKDRKSHKFVRQVDLISKEADESMYLLTNKNLGATKSKDKLKTGEVKEVIKSDLQTISQTINNPSVENLKYNLSTPTKKKSSVTINLSGSKESFPKNKSDFLNSASARKGLSSKDSLNLLDSKFRKIESTFKSPLADKLKNASKDESPYDSRQKLLDPREKTAYKPPIEKHSQISLQKKTQSFRTYPIGKTLKHSPLFRSERLKKLSHPDEIELELAKPSSEIVYQPSKFITKKTQKVVFNNVQNDHQEKPTSVVARLISTKSRPTNGSSKIGRKPKASIQDDHIDKAKRPFGQKRYESYDFSKSLLPTTSEKSGRRKENVIPVTESAKERGSFGVNTKPPLISRPAQTYLAQEDKMTFVRGTKHRAKLNTVGISVQTSLTRKVPPRVHYSKEYEYDSWGYPVTIVKEKPMIHQIEPKRSSRFRNGTPQTSSVHASKDAQTQMENPNCPPCPSEYFFFPFPDSYCFPCHHDDPVRCTICSARKNPIIDPRYPGRNPAYGRDMIYPIPTIPEPKQPIIGMGENPLCLLLDRRITCPDETNYPSREGEDSNAK